MISQLVVEVPADFQALPMTGIPRMFGGLLLLFGVLFNLHKQVYKTQGQGYWTNTDSHIHVITPKKH